MSSSTMLDPASYGECVAEHGGDRWPTAGLALLDELTVARGRVALIAASDPAEADDLVRRLSSDLGIDVSRLGSTLADSAQLPSAGDVESAFGSTLITDLDLLMWPDARISAVQLLSGLAHRRPTIAVWPGVISRGRATYSAPGRPDHHDIALRDVIVLRPRSTRFPDEVPFTIERILP